MNENTAEGNDLNGNHNTPKMPMEDYEIVHSGRVKFKAGLINKWTAVFCTLCDDLLSIYEQTDSDVEPIYSFSSSSSWISAKRSKENTLFVLNATDNRSASSKIFLFDTESSDLLNLWLHAFKTAGWSSAIIGEKLHYHRRSIGAEKMRHNKAYRESGFGGSLRSTRTQSEPTFFVTGRPTMGGDDSDLGHNRRWIGPRTRSNLSSIFAGIDVSSENNELESNDVWKMKSNTRRYEKDRISYDVDDHTNQKAKSLEDIKTRETGDTRTENNIEKNCFTKTNEQIRRSNSARIVRVNQFEVSPRNDERKRISMIEENPPEQNSNLEHSETTVKQNSENQQSEPVNIKNSFRPPRPGRFDYSRIFFDPSLSPDMKGKLLEAESRTRKTSLTRKGEHIRLSESDENEELRKATIEESFSVHSSLQSESVSPREIEVTNIDTGEKEAVNDHARGRKCSSVTSDGTADLNVDVDGDSSVFHPGTQGSHLSYLESGYCSKESISTNESTDHRKSSVSTFDEPNSNSNDRAELENDLENNPASTKSLQGDDYSNNNVHTSIKPASTESKNGHVADGTAGDTESQGQSSDTATMTPRPGRPSNMKLEKRSSMSQLLAQIKDRLPGRKNRGPKRIARKDLTGSEGSDPVLWNCDGKWKERWYAFCEGCLLFYKDAALRTPDFALDVRGCKLEIPSENQDQGFLGFKLVEISGKTNEFAAVTEESYNSLLSNINLIRQAGRHSDAETEFAFDDNENDCNDKESMSLEDAIIPYSESDHHLEGNQLSKENQRVKQESMDSGTDGDISCFEASDASNAGIEQYASGWKEKMVRRRKTSLVLPQPIIVTAPEKMDNGRGPLAEVRRTHRKIAHSESSPPSPRSANIDQTIDFLANSSREKLRPIDYLNVENRRRLPQNRYSLPSITQTNISTKEELNRQRRSCLEELLKLKSNQYPEKSGKDGKKRTLSVYSPGRKSPMVDENDNHPHVGSLDRYTLNSPIRSSSFKTNTSPNIRAKNIGSSKNRHRSMYVNSSPSNSVNLPIDFIDSSTDDLQQQTLLVKRRNSLRLQKDVVDQKVKALRERLTKNNAEGTDSGATEEEQNLSILENRLSNIEKELGEINENADIPPDDIFKDNKKKTGKQLFSKFKTTSKTSQNVNHKQINQKDNGDNVVTSPSLSPTLRKRSFSHNIKLFGGHKRDSDLSGFSSNRESMSSLESSTDAGLYELGGHHAGSFADLNAGNDSKTETGRRRKTSSVGSVSELDEVDGAEHNVTVKESSNVNEKGISKDALLKIEEFEQFAVEIAAKRVTDYVEV